jgi:hypothetical protein
MYCIFQNSLGNTSALRQVCTVEQVEQAAKQEHSELNSNQERPDR